jgi:hypothetical protein
LEEFEGGKVDVVRGGRIFSVVALDAEWILPLYKGTTLLGGGNTLSNLPKSSTNLSGVII